MTFASHRLSAFLSRKPCLRGARDRTEVRAFRGRGRRRFRGAGAVPAKVPGADDGDFANAKAYDALVVRLNSVIGVADASNGDLVERVRYTPYGVAQHWPEGTRRLLGDVDGDKDVDFADQNLILGLFGAQLSNTSSGYDPDDDLDQSGAIDFADLSRVLGNVGQSYTTLADGQLSRQTIANSIGYARYLFDPATEMYCVRFRWGEPDTGRWASRDRLLYFDGMNMYGYVGGLVLSYTDPLELGRKRLGCRMPGELEDRLDEWLDAVFRDADYTSEAARLDRLLLFLQEKLATTKTPVAEIGRCAGAIGTAVGVETIKRAAGEAGAKAF